MASKWGAATIKDVAEKVGMGPFGSSIKVETFVSDGVPIIGSKHLHKFKMDDAQPFKFITPDHAQRLANSNVVPGDIILTHRGSIGQVSYIPQDSQYTRYVISQSQFYMRCDRTKVMPEYVTMYFKSPEGQHQLLANTSQVGVPAIAQPVTYLRTIVIPLPPLEEQRRIAHILGTLDDKIELNRQINTTLEDMAQALFKSWFVDFEPVRAKMEGRWRRGESLPGMPADMYDLFPERLVPSELGEVPEGWEVKALDEIANFRNGLALQKFRPNDDEDALPVVKIAQLRSGKANGGEWATENITPECIIDNGDVIFSWSGSLMVKVWCGGRAALNQHLFKVTSAKYPKWFYLSCVQYHLEEFQGIAADKATTMGHIKRQHLREAKIVVPHDDLLAAADNFIAPLIEKATSTQTNSGTLEATRDVLLPRLLSGELQVV